MLSKESFIEKLKANKTKLVSFDMDGVMTDGKITFISGNIESRNFYAHDGYGIQMLSKAGIIVAIISSSRSAIMQARARVLQIEHCIIGAEEKGDAIRDICKRENISLEQALHMGDDVNDMGAFLACGLKVAPQNAVDYVKEIVDYTTQKSGGEGAVRELCELILTAHTGKPYLQIPAHTLPLQ